MTGERGSALVEFAFVGLALLIPVMWLLMLSAEVHRAALATVSAARAAGEGAADSTSVEQARRALDGGTLGAIVDHGLDPERTHLEWDAAGGLRRGGRVVARVSYRVPVFSIPFLGPIAGPDIVVRASHAAMIDPYRSRP